MPLLRWRLYRLSRQSPVKHSNCSEFEVNTWAVSAFVLTKLVPKVGVHPFPLNELMLMTAAVSWLKPTQIFEWGTNIGASARIFYECIVHYGIAAEIHSTDLPDNVLHIEHPHEQRGKLVRGLRHVHLHQGDGVEVSLNIWRTGQYKPHPLFLLDGDPSYETVLSELSAIVDEVPDPGILIHDSFYQSDQSGYNVGPHQAIEQVLSVRPNRFHRIYSGLGLPGMTFLYPLTQS